MGAGVTNFLSIIEARSLGTADIDKMAAAIDKQTASLDGLGKKATAINDHPGFGNFASKIKQGISDPLGTIEQSIESASSKFGIFGQVIGGTILTIGALSVAGFAAAKSLAEYGQMIENVGLRTGLTAKEVAQFGFAAKLVDQDISVFERAMRGLTEALTDNSAAGAKAREALQKLGVVPRELNGDLKPAGQLFRELSAALDTLPNTFERNRVGMDIFKRAWIEIGPSILKLNEGVRIANEQGFFGPSKAELEKWDDYDKKVTVAEAKLDRFYRKAKQFAAEALYADQDLVELRKQKDAAERGGTYNVPLSVLQGLPRGGSSYGYRFDAGVGAVESTIAADRDAGTALLNSSRGGMSRTLEGLRFTAEQAKTKYEDAYRSLQTLSDVGAAAAQKEITKVADLKKTYEGLNEQLKLAEKTETARLAILEKAQAFRQQGQPFYQFGDGPNAFFVTGQQITAANTRAPGGLQPPSLFRDASGRIAGSPTAPLTGLTAGVQANGDFVSPDASRATGVDSIDQLNARWAAFTAKRQTSEQVNLAIMMSEADTVARMIELRAGPGGELIAARQTADIREQSLKKELAQTGDIAKYREESRRNELDFALRIAEAEKQRIDTIRNLGSGFFDAALGGGSGIRQFGTNILLQQGRTIAGNAAADLFKGVSGHLGLPGDIFQGTILGKDPLKTATDLNTAATVANTAALRAFSMSPSSGGGGTFSSAASTFSKFGGFSSGTGGGYTSDGEQKYAPEYYDASGVFLGPSKVGASSRGGGSTASFSKDVGYAAAAVGGGFGIYSGIKMGGGRGAGTAVASALGAASVIPGPQQPFLAAGALMAGFITSLFGDPKVERAQQIDSELQAAHYVLPQSTTYTSDRFGRGFDYDTSGNTRTINVTLNVDALDSRSIIDRATDIADSLSVALEGRMRPDLESHIQRVALRG